MTNRCLFVFEGSAKTLDTRLLQRAPYTWNARSSQLDNYVSKLCIIFISITYAVHLYFNYVVSQVGLKNSDPLLQNNKHSTVYQKNPSFAFNPCMYLRYSVNKFSDLKILI